MLKMSHVLLTTVLAMSAVLPARSKAQTQRRRRSSIRHDQCSQQQSDRRLQAQFGWFARGRTNISNWRPGQRWRYRPVGIARCFNAERKAHTTIRSECG